MSGWRHVLGRLSGQYAPFSVRPVKELRGYHPVLFCDSIGQLGGHCPPVVAVRFQVRYPCLQVLHAGVHNVNDVGVGPAVRRMRCFFASLKNMFFTSTRRQHDKLAAIVGHRRELSATYTALHRPHGYTEALGCFFVADEVAVSGGHVSDMLSCVAATWQGRTRGAVVAQERREGDRQGEGPRRSDERTWAFGGCHDMPMHTPRRRHCAMKSTRSTRDTKRPALSYRARAWPTSRDA